MEFLFPLLEKERARVRIGVLFPLLEKERARVRIGVVCPAKLT